MTGIEAIVAAQAAGSVAPAVSAARAEASANAPAQSFAAMLAKGVEDVNAAMLRADAMVAQAAVDGGLPPHQVMLALEEARLSFHLALQVRNRLLEGYQELLRMQV